MPYEQCSALDGDRCYSRQFDPYCISRDPASKPDEPPDAAGKLSA